MIVQKIEDAHFFKNNIKKDYVLTTHESDLLHAEYVAFVNENYTLKAEKTELDHINNKAIHTI